MFFGESEKQQLAAMLTEAKKRYSPAALERIEEAFAMATGLKQPVGAQDPAQSGVSFFFPGLAAKPWHTGEAFPICDKLERAWESIRDELNYALNKRCGFQQYVLKGIEQKREWKAFYLKEHMEQFPENRAICPETVRAVFDDLRVANYVYFSALNPGGRIGPYYATYSWTFNVQMGLIVPDTRAEVCGMRVKDEARGWEEGKCMIFDASFEHEAWNRADSTMFVLVITTFHPDLTDIEVSLLQRVNAGLARADAAHAAALREGRKQLDGKKWWVQPGAVLSAGERA